MTRFWNNLHWVCSKPKSKMEKFLTNYVPPAKKQCLNNFRIISKSKAEESMKKKEEFRNIFRNGNENSSY